MVACAAWQPRAKAPPSRDLDLSYCAATKAVPAGGNQMATTAIRVLPSTASDRSSTWFSRCLAAIMRSRQAAAEREVMRLIERQGGVITDSVERRIGNHFV